MQSLSRRRTGIEALMNDKQMTIAMIAILSVLLLGRALSNSFFYIFAMVSLVIIAVTPVRICIPLLYFLLPFDTMMKASTSGMSFFTVLFFLVALKMLYHHQYIDRNFLMALVVFTVYCVIFSGLGQLTTIITNGGGLIILYCLRDTDVDVDRTIIAYSIGICFSSLLVVFKEQLPIINQFTTDFWLKFDEGDYAERFSGLQGNPNYYTIDINITLSAIVVMISIKKASFMQVACFAALTAFGLMSVSKSFILALAVLMAFWFISSAKHGINYVMKLILVVTFALAVIYYFAQDAVNAYLQRFLTDDTSSASSITTGRTDIWLEYLEAIFENYKILLFGNGLNTMIPRGVDTHNAYLQSLFTLGITGSALYYVAIKKAMGKVITNKIMWLPVAMLLARMLAAGILVHDNMWFYLGLIELVARQCEFQNGMIPKSQI